MVRNILLCSYIFPELKVTWTQFLLMFSLALQTLVKRFLKIYFFRRLSNLTIMFRLLFFFVPLQAVLFQKLQKFLFLLRFAIQQLKLFPHSSPTIVANHKKVETKHVTVCNEWAKCQTFNFLVDVIVWGQPALWLGQTMSHKLIKHCYLLHISYQYELPWAAHTPPPSAPSIRLCVGFQREQTKVTFK